MYLEHRASIQAQRSPSFLLQVNVSIDHSSEGVRGAYDGTRNLVSGNICNRVLLCWARLTKFCVNLCVKVYVNLHVTVTKKYYAPCMNRIRDRVYIIRVLSKTLTSHLTRGEKDWWVRIMCVDKQLYIEQQVDLYIYIHVPCMVNDG